MISYKEFTFGWMTFGFIIPIQLLITFFYLNGIGDKPIDTPIFLFITLIFILVAVLLFGMTTIIDTDIITVSFGIGLIRKTINLNNIKTVSTVVSPWYYGWGIRFIPNGTLLNMSGNKGIEIKLKDTDRIIRIGTKDSIRLKEEIEKRLI